MCASCCRELWTPLYVVNHDISTFQAFLIYVFIPSIVQKAQGSSHCVWFPAGIPSCSAPAKQILLLCICSQSLWYWDKAQ